MNRFSEQLLEAFEVAMDEKISKLQYDKTIQATITEIKDANTGEYKVKYQEGIISAFAYDPKEQFKIGDSVYVTVPQGDFSNKKFISHKLTNNTLTTGQYNDLSETIIEVSPDLSKLGYTYNNFPQNQDYWGLIGGSRKASQETQINGIDQFVIWSGSGFTDAFKSYLDRYEYLQIKAEFMTTFETSPIIGDYGIRIDFIGTQGQKIPCFLNISNFSGDPYHLWTWTPQSAVIKLPKESITGLSNISFYETITPSINEPNIVNIFMKNLSISFVEKVDLTEVPYYLQIIPKEGLLFTNQNNYTIHLNGKIIHYGEEIISDSCVYKWYKRDLNISAGDEGYNKQVGWGWKPVQESNREIGTETNELIIVNGSTKNIVKYSQTYKLLVLYNSSIIMTKEITLLAPHDNTISIKQVIEGEDIKLQLSDYLGAWYYLDASGNQQLIAKNINEVNVTPYLFYSPMTFYCQIQDSENNYLGEIAYTMKDLESNLDVSVIFTGESFYCYDANGNLDLEYTLVEHSLIPTITFSDGTLNNIAKITWLDGDGADITASGYVYDSSNSMIESVRVDKETKTLYYKIKSRFEEVLSKKRNTFTLQIIASDGSIYTFDKEIVCIKVGDPGTNGTQYQSIIRIDQNSRHQFVWAYDNSIQISIDAADLTVAKFILWETQKNDMDYLQLLRRDSSNNWSIIKNNISPNAKSITDDNISSLNGTYVYQIKGIKNGQTKFSHSSGSIVYPVTSQTVVPNPTCRVRLKCEVYKNQELLDEEKYSVTWQSYELYSWQDKNDNDNILQVQSSSGNRQKYVKATININDDGVKTTLYNFYPINSITQVDTDSQTIASNFDFSSLPFKIQYAANGLNPQCKKKVPLPLEGSVYPNIEVREADNNNQTLLSIINGNFIPKPEFDPTQPIVTIRVQLNKNLTVFHPIPMYINTFGNEAINGWDGVALDLGDEADSHVFAPQIGAGTKNEANKFTGVVMGKDSAEQKIGLYGYQTGEAVFGLKEDGTAFFGKSGKGRIEIDGNSATIKGGGGGESSSGMTITLSAQSDATAINENAIRVGNDKFIVNYAGQLTAKEVNVQGEIEAIKGSIGGWEIGKYYITSGTIGLVSSDAYPCQVTLPAGTSYWIYDTNTKTKTTEFQTTEEETYIIVDTIIPNGESDKYVRFTRSDGTTTSYLALLQDIHINSSYRIWSGNGSPYHRNTKFTITSTGTIKATDAEIQGKITASTGSIGGWNIDKNNIYKSSGNNKYAVLSTQGNYAFYAGSENVNGQNAPFSVTFDGKLKATNAEITGKITAGTGSNIGGWTLTDTQLYSGTVHLYSGKENNYEVEDSNPVDYYRIWAGNNTPTKSKFYVTNSGKIQATDAEITGKIFAKEGYIGYTDSENRGWHITKNTLESEIDTTYYLKAGSQYRKQGTDSSQSITIQETVPIKMKNLNQNAFTFIDDDVIYVTARDNIDNTADHPYVGLFASGRTAIQIGNSNSDKAPFKITHAGYLTATKATISGDITATSGAIGGKTNGWKITTGQLSSGQVHLYSGTDSYEVANSDPVDYYRIWAGSNEPASSKFYVTNGGKLKATDAIIQGDITAKTGSIGSWTITTNAISTLNNESTVTTSDTTGMAKNGFIGYIQRGEEATYTSSQNEDKISGIAFWSGMKYVQEVDEEGKNRYYLQGNSNGTFFAVTHSGQLYCRNAKIQDAAIEGSITVGNGARIGDWYIRDGILKNSSTGTATAYIGPTMVQLPGLTLTQGGTASFTGDITTTNIRATGGSIGGWNITTRPKDDQTVSTLSASSTYLDSDGTISGATISGGSISIGNGNFVVTSDGTMTANGTLSLTGAIGNQNIISISGTYQIPGGYQILSCEGSLGLATGSPGGGQITYNTKLYSSQNLILEAGAVRVDTLNGFYVDVGDTSNIISVPSSGDYVNLNVTADGLTILENGVATSLATYVSSHGGGGNVIAVFG